MTSLVPCAITLKDPSGVFARQVILKMEKINVKVTLQDPLIETLRYFVVTFLSRQFPLFKSCFFTRFALI